MKKYILFFIALFNLVSCYYYQGTIIEKEIEDKEISYLKKENYREESYYNMITDTWEYRKVATGEYDYYKCIDTTDYKITCRKIIETKNGNKIQERTFYANKELYLMLNKNQKVKIKYSMLNMFSDFPDSYKFIEISKEEYLKGISNNDK